MPEELITLDSFRQELMITDLQNIVKLAEPIKLLKNQELLDLYDLVLDQRIKTWALRCLISFEVHRRGVSYEDLGKVFDCVRQTAWDDSEIWEHIISKDSLLLLEKRKGMKTFMHNVVRLHRKHIIENPAEEMWWIIKHNDKIDFDNFKRKEAGLPLLIKLTPSTYYNGKMERYYYCDVCNQKIYPYNKVILCDKCKEERIDKFKKV